MNAYAGKVLHVNLTSGQVRTEVFDERTVKLYLGGVGLGVNLLMEYSKVGKDAFDPDTPLIYCTGPLSGTLGFGGNGYVVVSKSPLSGGVGEGQVQSFFGSKLKRAGYDAVVIKGRASGLSYLWIDDDQVQIRSALHLCGDSVSVVEQKLCDELDDFSVCVSGIGEAGERLCRLATIVSGKYQHTVGRGVGLGAVMGSKNLKAVVVRGTHDVDVANLESFAQFVKARYEHVGALGAGKCSHLLVDRLLELNSLSAVATRNWNNSVFDGVKKICSDYLTAERFVKKSNSCAAACGGNCNSVVMVSDGVFKDEMASLNLDCLLSLGSLCGVDSLDAIVKAASLISTYGLDCVSVGAVVAFAMDLYERGMLTCEQAGGVDLRFGNVDALLDLICKIGKSEGWLGKILAEGVARAADAIGGEAAKYACHVKGLELPGYDLRALKNMALGFSVAFSGDGHMRNGVELLDVSGKVDRYRIENDVGSRLVEESMLYNVLNSLILCKLHPIPYTWKDLADYYLFATGIQVTEEELKLSGKRIETLARLFNILEGRGTRNYDDLPYKIKNCPISDEVPENGLLVSDDELQSGIDYYYVACGWTADGIPTVDCLKQLGLGHLAYISENAIKAAQTLGEN